MKPYKNILVNALVNLGDVVLTTGAVALLKKAYPDARITMLVKPVVREAVEDNPVIDEVLVFGYKAKQNSLGKMLGMVREIKARRFDLSISFDRKLRPALVAFLAGIPVRVGPSRVFDAKPSRVTWLYTKTVPITHDLEKTLQAKTYQVIVRGVTGLPDEGLEKPVFSRTRPEHEEKAAQLLARLPQAEKRIALCVKGTFPLKTWPQEYFAEVVEGLERKYDAAFFVVGAPGDREYAAEVIAGMKTKKTAENFCGDTGLRDLAALIRAADLFLTVDTGATHIAATTGTPLVTVYGCTSPDRWQPISENVRVFTAKEPCCPCSHPADGCPSWPQPSCLWNVRPQEVLEACIEMLGR